MEKKESLSTDGALGDDTLTPYDFAMEEVGMVSTSLALALLARTLTQDAVPETECAEARRVYQKLIDLHPRLRLDASQRASLLAELALLRTRLDECDRSRG